MKNSVGTAYGRGYGSNADSKSKSRLYYWMERITGIAILAMRRIDPLPFDSFFPSDIDMYI